MLNQFVQSVIRLLPRAEPARDVIDWGDSDRSWHSSRHERSSGLNVIERFEALPAFPDTLPAFHFPPSTQALAR